MNISTPSPLQKLADNRKALRQAELAALLHDLGKCSSAFVQSWVAPAPGKSGSNYQYVTGLLAEWYEQNKDRLSPDKKQRVEEVGKRAIGEAGSGLLNDESGKDQGAWFRQKRIRLPEPLNDHDYSFAQFMEFHLGWYSQRPSGPRIDVIYPSAVPRTTALVHAAHDAASGGEKQPVAGRGQPAQPNTAVSSTAFGWETALDLAALDAGRQRIVQALVASAPRVFETCRTVLQQALGDTQRPLNDVTLWDLGASTAALFKAAAAGAILSGWKDWSDVKWRLLHVSFNGPAFWGEAHHVTDLLGRRQALENGLDAVRQLLEQDYPLGNEVYRDENGSVFVVPDIDKLLSLQNAQGVTLENLIRQVFDSSVADELRPAVDPTDSREGKTLRLSDAFEKRPDENELRSETLGMWWGTLVAESSAEICTVCQRRPVGYMQKGLNQWVTSKKARERNVCGVCLDRRGRRARDWMGRKRDGDEVKDPFERTIWLDEVADDNGRAALIVGRFDLIHWLDELLIPTTLKNPSFARVQRCWRTTRDFWRDVRDTTIPDQLAPKPRLRLGLRPSGPVNLGEGHAYELPVRGLRLGVCYEPPEKENSSQRGRLWTTTNLRYFARQLGIDDENLLGDNEKLGDQMGTWLQGPIEVYEPGGYLGQDKPANVRATLQVEKPTTYLPYIPLLVEPTRFMALVPADAALGILTCISEKYAKEMARVRDRLPLDLGLVVFPRRTPIAAVVDAGRRLLDGPQAWEGWPVASKTDGAMDYSVTLKSDRRSVAYTYPKCMEDGSTPDEWYPHLLLADPDTKNGGGQLAELQYGSDFKHVKDIVVDEKVYHRPSWFDFEFLDTSSRRHDIAYRDGRRTISPNRPYLLSDLADLQMTWDRLLKLKPTQLRQVIQTIESTRDLWFGADAGQESWRSDVFEQFVRDTLLGAHWPSGDRPSGAKLDELVQAGKRGVLSDLAELHFEILKDTQVEG